MKKKMVLTVLAVCSSLMAGTSFAEDLFYVWDWAGCEWPGGCRYTYQVPNPPAGKGWSLEVKTNVLVNDGKTWMTVANRKVAMTTSQGIDDSHQHAFFYRGAMPTGGEIEFLMPRVPHGSPLNKAVVRGTLVNAN